MQRHSDAPAGMSAEDFKAWRKLMGLKQKDVADQLGLKKRMIQYYEKGCRDGRPVEIPKTVRLACYALSQGVSDFNGNAAISMAPVASKSAARRKSDQRPARGRRKSTKSAISADPKTSEPEQ